MASNLYLPLTPAGLIVDRHEIAADCLIIHAHGAAVAGTCPGCGSVSASIHSHYIRSAGDFPAHGRRLMIRLTARRFRCCAGTCDRKTFAKRFSDDVIAVRAQRTCRLDRLIHSVGVALGGKPGSICSTRFENGLPA
jgi:transposase